MGDGDKKGGGSPAPLLVAAIVFAVGLVAKQFDLDSRRPAQSERPAHYSQALQTVPARLWQDPMAAIADLRGKSELPPGIATVPTPDKIVQAYLGGYAGVFDINVLLVSLYGGQYSEYSEARRRQRYAVVTGLLESGFMPADGEQLGILRHKFPNGQVVDIAFEWYGCWDRASKKCEDDALALVMWVNEEVLGEYPLTTLSSLYPTNTDKYRITKSIVGPAGSGTLIGMLSETNGDTQHLAGIRIFSPNATMDPSHLLRWARISPEPRDVSRGIHDAAPDATSHWHNVKRAFNGAGLTFVSTVGTDGQLAEMLAREVTLRQYSLLCLLDNGELPPECLKSYKVLVVSEGDAVYADSLANTFKEKLVSIQCGYGGQPDCRDQVKGRVSRMTYLRGLDGETPRLPGDAQDKDAKKAGGKTDRPADKPSESVRRTENAAGNAQLDYLRRLGRSAKALERTTGYVAPGLYHAIAIFGSDAYDKLLVMQALRSEFPSAFFITTDLDARYLQREELEWSRNLIIASSYGLELNRNLHTRSGPFRDAYQSAQFVAARLAVTRSCDRAAQDFIDSRLSQPNLYEVSNGGLVDLQPQNGVPGNSWLRMVVEERPAARLSFRPAYKPKPGVYCDLFMKDGREISSLHPDSASRWLWYLKPLGATVAALLLLVAWYSVEVRRRLRFLWLRALQRWPEILLAFGVGGWILLPARLVWIFALSVLVAAAVCWITHRILQTGRTHAGGRHALRMPLAAALAVLAVALFVRACADEQAWVAAVSSLPVAGLAGALAHPLGLSRRSPTIIIGLPLTLLLLAICIAALTSHGEEPIGLFDGASSWMSEALRAAALIFNLSAVAVVFQRLRASEAEIRNRFFPDQPIKVPASPGSLRMLRRPWKSLENWRDEDFLTRKGLDGAALWGAYVGLCNPRRLCWRAGIGTLLFWVIFAGLIVANPPIPPVRGVWSNLLDSALLLLAGLTFFFLIFVVVDVVRLTEKFVRFQSMGQTSWPKKVLPVVVIEDVEPVLCDATDLALLSSRTETVSRLVILPFVPLLLLLLARHELVDAWAWTWPTVLLYLSCFGFLIWMSVRLRGAADAGRSKVLKRVAERRLQTLGKNQATTAQFLENMMQSMDRVSAGAYAPFWQADWLKGLVIPTTGYGLFEILRGLGML
jgi:hypothetical protein